MKVYIIIKKNSPRTPESPQWNKPGKLKYSHRKSSSLNTSTSLYASFAPQSIEHICLQKHCIIHRGTMFQISRSLLSPKLFFQQDNNSNTEGTTGDTPNKQKIRDHISQASLQWRKRWDTLFSWLLHIKHQSIMINPCFLKHQSS